MFLPIGLDETRVSRLPWVSIAIVALNVVAFVATEVGGDDEVQARFEAVVRYWAERPYLEPPPELGDRFGLDEESVAGLAQSPPRTEPPGDAGAEQAELDRLAAALVVAHDAMPVRRWALVPARGALQPGWLTHQFLHGGLWHLLGNMFVFFLVVGPFLEDVWGRPFFLAFYLVGGALAGVAQAVPMGDSPTAVIGASGAISACLGAFALRFAHRRVRIFYWLFLFLRGTFFVPAWLYAFFGLVIDLLGLRLEGTGGGVAYGAHVGGFLFGLGAAMALRVSGLEGRLTPEGAAPPSRTLGGARAAEALAFGHVSEARSGYEEVLRRDPDDVEAMHALLSIAHRAIDREGVTRHLERLVMKRVAANDPAGARALLTEHGELVNPAAWRPSTALRAGELLAADAPSLADHFDEAASAAGGALGAKALLRRAERARHSDPSRALEWAEQALALTGLPADLADRVRAAVASLGAAVAPPAAERPGPADVPAAAIAFLPADVSVRLVACRLVDIDGATLRFVTEGGQKAELAAARVAAVAAGLVLELGVGGERLRNRVLLDLLVRPRDGERGRTVVRLLGHALPFERLFPGVAPLEAFGRVVDGLVAAGGAAAVPSAAAAAGRPLTRFADVAAFEGAVWGRRLSA